MIKKSILTSKIGLLIIYKSKNISRNFSSPLFSCKQNDRNVIGLENQLKELKQELDNVYKPGLGVMMRNIQTNHSKLWFSKDYNISVANNGIEALEIVKFKTPDLIISDVIMPEMDGYQLCEK